MIVSTEIQSSKWNWHQPLKMKYFTSVLTSNDRVMEIITPCYAVLVRRYDVTQSMSDVIKTAIPGTVKQGDSPLHSYCFYPATFQLKTTSTFNISKQNY